MNPKSENFSGGEMSNLHVPETFAVILGLSTILSMFFGSVGALVDDGLWKPFESLAIAKDSNFLPSIHPIIKVQSELSEGLGWDGQHPLSQSKALHVVVSVLEFGDKDDVPIPGHRIRIRSQSPLPCIVEQGNNAFEDCNLAPSDSRDFVTNLLGRVSFSVPLDGIVSFDNALPPLWIQSASMPKSQWYFKLILFF